MHYAYFESDHVEELFRTVEHGMSDPNYDFDGIRPFFILAENLFASENPIVKEKLNDWLIRFLKWIMANKNYYKWMEVAFEYIFKIVAKNPTVRDWFYKKDNHQYW